MKRVFKPIEKAYYRALGYYPTTIHDLEFRCDPYNAKFWKTVSQGRWEAHTYRILARFLSQDSVYCDIGAWIGPTAIFAARKCKQVFCFEPDILAYEHLLWNIRLNRLHNVIPFNLALTDNNGIRPMASFGGKLGDGMTSLLKTDQAERTTHALCMTWETWTAVFKPERIDFMKIDIEGGEFVLLPTIKDYLALRKPIVYLSTHAPYLDGNRRREEMQRVIQVMEIYGQCFNEALEGIKLQDLIADDAMNNFRSYLFMD